MQQSFLIPASLIGGLLLTLLVLVGIPTLTAVSKPRLETTHESPVLLSLPERIPQQEKRKNYTPRKPERIVQPRTLPKLAQTRKTSPLRKPKLHVALPKLDITFNTSRAQGMPVAQPEVETPAPTPVVSAAPALPAAPAKTQFELGEVDTSPRILGSVPPVYPYSARRKGIEGWVTVRFLVTVEGEVTQPTIVEASPKGIFENSVLSAVRQWRFTPGRIKGQPVPTWVVAPLKFALSS